MFPSLPPHPQPLLINTLDVDLVNDLLSSNEHRCHAPVYCSWGREMGPFERFKGERVKDQDCMKGENPSICKMFLMLHREYFVGPHEVN